MALLFAVLLLGISVYCFTHPDSSREKKISNLPETIRKFDHKFTITDKLTDDLVFDHIHSLLYVNMNGIQGVFPASKIQSFGYITKKRSNVVSRAAAGTVLFGPVGGAIGAFTGSSSSKIYGYYITIAGLNKSLVYEAPIECSNVAQYYVSHLKKLTGLSAQWV